MRLRAILYVALGLALLLAGAGGQALQAQTGQTCGGIGALKCPAGQACKLPEGQCNTADLAGTCVPLEKVCPKTGPPVCGCNGETYANECELLQAGVRPAKKGACGKPAKAAHPCKSDAECSSADRELCEFKTATCGSKGAGRCIQKPELCPQIFAPVCGCDNKTYPNDCERRAAGVSLKSTGECPGTKKPS